MAEQGELPAALADCDAALRRVAALAERPETDLRPGSTPCRASSLALFRREVDAVAAIMKPGQLEEGTREARRVVEDATPQRPLPSP